MSNRYAHNIRVIGEQGQNLLSGASALVIGCGALGGQVAMLLAAAGIGKIGIADFDTIEISNLQRQLFFAEHLAGAKKATILAERMAALNSSIDVVVYDKMISKTNADSVFPDYDIIVDATDNPSTKYFVDECAARHGLPCCIGGVEGWRGQVAMIGIGNNILRYRDIFTMPIDDPSMLPCEISGVMGPTASVVSSIQASETIQWLVSEDNVRSKLISVDLFTSTFSTLYLDNKN